MPRGRKRKSEILGDETANDSSIGPIDEHVGARICARRKLLQLSQKQMAEKLGITFQQIQKYEKGVTFVTRSGLIKLEDIYKITIFDDEPVSDDVKQRELMEILVDEKNAEIVRLYEQLKAKDEQLAKKDEQLRVKDVQIAEKDKQ